MNKPVVIAGVVAVLLIGVGLYLRQRQNVTARETKSRGMVAAGHKGNVPLESNDELGILQETANLARRLNPFYDEYNDLPQEF